jgi:hypothetical protein
MVVGAPGYAVVNARYCAPAAAKTPAGAACKQLGARQVAL